MKYKPCRTCGEVKPLSEFYAKGDNADGHSNVCKPCKIAYDREHKRKDDYIEPDNSDPRKQLRPAEQLALAILINAVRESRRDRSTRKWLLSREARFYCESLDIRHQIIVNFVKLGCPGADLAEQARLEIFEGV